MHSVGCAVSACTARQQHGNCCQDHQREDDHSPFAPSNRTASNALRVGAAHHLQGQAQVKTGARVPAYQPVRLPMQRGGFRQQPGYGKPEQHRGDQPGPCLPHPQPGCRLGIGRFFQCAIFIFLSSDHRMAVSQWQAWVSGCRAGAPADCALPSDGPLAGDVVMPVAPATQVQIPHNSLLNPALPTQFESTPCTSRP